MEQYKPLSIDRVKVNNSSLQPKQSMAEYGKYESTSQLLQKNAGATAMDSLVSRGRQNELIIRPSNFSKTNRKEDRATNSAYQNFNRLSDSNHKNRLPSIDQFSQQHPAHFTASLDRLEKNDNITPNLLGSRMKHRQVEMASKTSNRMFQSIDEMKGEQGSPSGGCIDQFGKLNRSYFTSMEATSLKHKRPDF